jgi:hypothetical protein
MAKRVALGARDTLGKIAEDRYGDRKLAKALAEYNGIRDPKAVVKGQVIELPSKRELTGPTAAVGARSLPRAGLAPPNGLQEVLATFGDIYKYLKPDGTIDPKWEIDQIASAPLPFPIPLSWDTTKQAKSMRVHKKIVTVVQDSFKAIQTQGLQAHVRTFGGAYNFRSKRTSSKLSTHCWGIAFDLNPNSNAMGTAGDMHPGVVEVLRSFGWKWGGDWTGAGKDPMHFQFCTGY